MIRQIISKLICLIRGHDWPPAYAKQYVCKTNFCYRCGAHRVIHLWSKSAHTCVEFKGKLNEYKENEYPNG